MKSTLLFLIILVALTVPGCSQDGLTKIDLSGEWQFQMDHEDRGIDENWFGADLPETVQLPGSMVKNGKGYDITLETEWTGGIRNSEWYKDPNYEPYLDSNNIRFPYWLQPEKKYTGAAWYLKKVNIPKGWNNKTIRLILERPHWESTLWVNGKKVNTQNSLATSHIYDISSYLTSGENTIAIRVDNRTDNVDPGVNSHSITDHTQTNWNGIVGNISLQAVDRINFEDVEVFPDIKRKVVELKVYISNELSESKTVKFTINAQLKRDNEKVGKKTVEQVLTPGKNIVNISYPMGKNALLWDEFAPNVYQLSLKLQSGKVNDTHSVDFGLRDFHADGPRFTINDRPVFLRGTLECCIFPKTGYPPTDVAEWEKVFSAVKAHGLNHVRFHSWCPPEAAFKVADKMGVYLQVECSSWANQSTQIGSGFPIDQYIWDESQRIVKAYGNHPSFVMLAYGNEPGGPKHVEFLTKFVSHWKNADNRRVYTSGAGWPALAVNDYHDIPQPRIQGWGEELNSIINAQPPKTDFDWSGKVPGDGIPVVSHEIGQWCVYPNFKEIEKYTGVLKAKNFELFRESLESHHMGHLAENFLLASGKLQALCYKADIEAALRTPGFAGFQLLDLHDFPGQGTALVGVLDPFWEEKGYISPAEYSRFCNSTVPLARLKKRIFTEDETLIANIEVAHFGETPLKAANPIWKLFQNTDIIAEGTLGQRDIPIGNGISLGKVVYQFQQKNNPRKLTLEVGIGNFKNSWDIWVYPEKQVLKSDKIRVVEKLDQKAINFLEGGGNVLLSLGKGKVAPDMGGKVGVGFSSIFWNTAWTGGQKPHTLGILCNPEHPALELFPTEYHSNWQWWDAMSHCDAIQLDSFPAELKPIVYIIDDWVSNRRLAMLFEAKVGKGRILVSGTDLVNNMESRPEARQMRSSLLKYMSGNQFEPNVQIKTEGLGKIVK
jgi:hypothetical protein